MNANSLVHRSIASIPEAELLEMLLSSRLDRSDLFGIRGIPDAPVTATSRSLKTLSGSPKGDVDLLAWSSTSPHEAVAYQMKRFKVTVQADLWGQPNKLQEFEEGVRQANLLEALGFHQVYLWVFVVVDSRPRNRGRISYDGLTSELRATIDAAVSTRGLNQRVGLVTQELVQPMDNPPLRVGTGHLHLVRAAGLGVQPRQVTAWVGAQHGAG